MADPYDFFADWLPLDPKALPDPKKGPFLTTNNAGARNAHGLPSHVWLTTMFHVQDDDVTAGINDAGTYARFLTHYKPVFAAASLERAIEHAVNYESLDAKLDTADYILAEKLAPIVQTYLHGRSDVQVYEAEQAAIRAAKAEPA